MSNALKRELFWLSSLTALTSLVVGRRRAASYSALAAAGFWLTSMKESYTLRERSLFITGGSRGLGLSLAWNALERGARAVTLVARKEAELERAREILLQSFPDALVCVQVCDVTEREALATAIDNAIDRMGTLDILINNAGAMLVAPLDVLKREDFEAQMKLHLFGVVDAVQLIRPYFKSRGEGRILNICSLGGKAAIPHMLPYDASKFALAGFAQGASAELAADGIKMTTAYPTVMRTGSPRQAVFKGDHEKEFAWFAGLDNMPGLSLSADTAAKKILEALVDGRSEVILSVAGQARVLAGAIIPETLNFAMGLAARLLPRGSSEVRKTGAQSAELFEKNIVFAPLEKKAREVEGTYNQIENSDADFNLGLKH